MNFSYYLESFEFLMKILKGINPKIWDEDMILPYKLLIIGHHMSRTTRMITIIITIQMIMPIFLKLSNWVLIFTYNFSK